MTTRIRYLGVAAYEVVGPAGRILFDPFLTGNPVAPCTHEDLEAPDVILVSHPPVDHLGDTAEIAIRTGAPVVCGTDSAALLRERGVPDHQIRTTIWGIQVEVGGVHVRPVEAHHWSQARLADGSVITGAPLGFVVETEPGVRVYHFGDSAIFGDMRLIGRLHQPTVGLLGCTQPKPLLPLFNKGAGRVLTGEMDPDEAALAAEFLGVRYALATHYVDPDDEDVRSFLERVPVHDTTGGRVALALRPDETLVIDGEQHHVEPAPSSAER
jgi:L-ascorbate metabolism protein UlaG (beta-lactamase superfamily)